MTAEPKVGYANMTNYEKAYICELFVSGLMIKEIMVITGRPEFSVNKVISRCLFGVPKSEGCWTLVLQSKINEDE